MRRLAMLAVMVAMVAAGCGKDDTTKPTPTGSCCAPAGTCTVITQAVCTGTWDQAGVCDPNPCMQPPPTGMVLIPAGTFTMGSRGEPGGGGDGTPHRVTLTRAFYVSKCEVTQAEWEAVMGWNESRTRGPSKPAEWMTWYDAAIYCNHLSTLGGCDLAYTITVTSADGDHVTSAAVTWNRSTNGYRLLTEAEWEYACRAGSTGAFCNGGISGTDCADVNLDLVGWYCGNASDTTHDVGGKAANAWGLHDMHGNVYEWCWDWYGDYDYPGPVTDPVGPSSGEYRNWRGGGFRQAAQYCRSAFRNPGIPGSRGPGVGLRVARTAE